MYNLSLSGGGGAFRDLPAYSRARVTRETYFYRASFYSRCLLSAKDSLKMAQFHAVLDDVPRCSACVGLLSFERRCVLQAFQQRAG